MNSNKKRTIMRTLIVLMAILVTINLITLLNKDKNTIKPLLDSNYTQLMSDISNKKIDKVDVIENKNGTRQLKVFPKNNTPYIMNVPQHSKLMDELVANDVKVHVPAEESDETAKFLTNFFFSWGPIIFFVIVMVMLMKKTNGSGSGLFTFNKSKAQLIDPNNIKVSFEDVVGCEEAKQEAQEFVDFLKHPDKFSKLGGRTPRGVLLTGPAGTGKTLLAKALAKESGVPFYATSGSEFVEMFVGVGAGRVRDMFETAKKVAPCVLFIDEIDAIGGKRGQSGTGGGGNDEREQTLNQILVEMDGMDTNKGVILVGATNRPDVLDPALMRPGRFDRQIVVGLPDVKGRFEILKIHSKNVPLDRHVDLSKIARGTPGFSGAELANLINEASIFAAREDKKFVEQIDLEKAKDKVMMGLERPSLAMSEEDMRKTAYHEAGHAVIAKLLPKADPVHKVTIIPRGRALGLTMQLPEKDRYSYEKDYLIDRITILMGGRAAEEIFCNTFTNGASNDIAVATSTARSMVKEWGMSALGPIAFSERQGSGYLGSYVTTADIAASTLEKIDLEVSKLIQEEYDRAVKMLKENADIVEAMTEALMKVETIDDWQIENLMKRRPYDDNEGLKELRLRQDEMERREKVEFARQEDRRKKRIINILPEKTASN